MDPVRINVAFSSPWMALKYSRSEGKELSLFVPTGHQPPLRARVALAISFPGRPERFELSGTVIFIREVGRGLLQPQGVVVDFQAPEEKQTAAAFIAFCAGRPASLGTAGTPRTQVASRCIVRSPRGAFRGHLRDVSATGAFVAARLPGAIKEGVEILLQVKPIFGAFGGRQVRARVMWLGEKYGEKGFGARFTGEAEEIRRAVALLT